MFGQRFERSLVVAKESWAVLRNNPALAIFPVLSGIATLLVSAPFLVILALTAFGQHRSPEAFGPVHYAVTFAMYFVNYFVIVFFNSALVACANENLQGRPTTMAFGLHVAIRNLPKILGWAAIAATVGTILRVVSERVGIVGAIIGSLLGLAWNLAVFFVVPCMILDQEPAGQAIKTSTGMIKRTWGERVILGVGIGTITGLFMLLAFVPILGAVALAVSGLYVLAIALGILSVILILMVSTVSSAMSAIFQTALYLYCRHNAVPAGFQQSSLANAFAPKGAPASRGR